MMMKSLEHAPSLTFGWVKNLAAVLAFSTVLLAPMPLQAQTAVASIPIGPQPALTYPSMTLLNPANHKVYVVGNGGTIAVVDGTTNRTISHIAGTNGAAYGMLLNKPANQIYLIGGTIQVLDSATDTIVNTFTVGPIPGAITDPAITQYYPNQYVNGAYNPVTNILYMDEVYEVYSGINIAHEDRMVAIDGSTGAELGVLLASGDPTLPFVGVSLVNPATNKIYTIASGSDLTVGGYEVYDGATYARLAGSLFAAPEATNFLRGYFQSFDINPADNSIWIASFAQTSVLTADGTVLWTPDRTNFYRIDAITNLVTTYSTFGYFKGLGFDPASGRYIGIGGCIPTTATPPPDFQANPCSITNTTGFNPLNLAALDPTNPTGLIAVNTSGFPQSINATNGACGVGIFGLVGADVSGGNLYWTSRDCAGAHAQINVGKADFTGTPAPGFPPTLSAHWVADIPTGVSGLYDVPLAFSKMAVDPSTHVAFFLTPNENTITAVDPAIPAALSQRLGNTPAGLAVNSVTHTVFVGDLTTKTLNVLNGATNTVSPQTYVGAGPYTALNSATNQVVMAGPSNAASDPNQVQGAVLLDGSSGAVIRTLEAAATSPVAVNPATNIAYFANGAQWYAVDLATGTRTFSGSDLSGTGTDTCQITGVGVNAATNRVYLSGKCQANGQTLAVYDGATNTLIQQTSLGAFITVGTNFGFGALAVNNKTNKVYVENILVMNPGGITPFEEDAIEVFDGASLAHLASIKGARGQMAINTVTNVVYACGGYCTAIDGRTDTYIGPFGTPTANKSAVAVDEATNSVYIASDRADNDPVGRALAGFVTVFPGIPGSFSVSGTIATAAGVGVAGITVAVSGPITTTAVTNANGLFTVPRLLPGTYTLTPAGTGFVFAPASQTVTSAGAMVTGVTFTAVPAFSISGQVVDALGAALPGMTVASQGVVTTTAVTDVNGQFTMTGFPAGTYTIVPTTPAFLYTPASQSVTVAAANVTGVSFSAVPTFNTSGQVLNVDGTGLAGVTVTSQGGVTATAVTGASGQFTLTGFPAGTYTITPSAPGVIFGPSSQTIKVAKADTLGVNFTVIPPIAITSYTLSPYTTIGPGVVTNGTIVLNQVAQAGGVTVTLSASDAKPAKFPSTVTVAQGQTSVTFTVQGNSVSAATTAILKASYQGPLAPLGTSATTSLTVAPSDTLHVTKATWSTSSGTLTVTATSTNPQAIIAVLNANGNVPLGTMTNLGNGNYTFQLTTTSISSVSIKSNLGGSTGQGVSVVP